MRRKELMLHRKFRSRLAAMVQEVISPIRPSSIAFLAVWKDEPRKVSGAEPRYRPFSSESLTSSAASSPAGPTAITPFDES